MNFQKEHELFDYHYVPFYWDNTKWRKDGSVSLKDNELYHDGILFGLVKDNTFVMEWEDAFSFEDEDYNKCFRCASPYFAQPSMRLKKAENLLHFYQKIEPGERKTFLLAF